MGCAESTESLPGVSAPNDTGLKQCVAATFINYIDFVHLRARGQVKVSRLLESISRFRRIPERPIDDRLPAPG